MSTGQANNRRLATISQKNDYRFQFPILAIYRERKDGRTEPCSS